MNITLPLHSSNGRGGSFATAQLFNSGGFYAIWLLDHKEKRIGRSYTFSGVTEAKRFHDEMIAAKPHDRISLIYARLGYGETRGLKRTMASTACHPGMLPVQGRP